jgi:hypothetical protein
MPLIVKSAPVSVSNEIVRFAVPEFVSTRLLVAFNPADTVPKLIAGELSANCA